MVCKSCSTRVGPSDRYCPNCGRSTSPGTSLSGAKPTVEAPPLPPARPARPSEEVTRPPAPAVDLARELEVPLRSGSEAPPPAEKAEATAPPEPRAPEPVRPREPVVEPDDDTESEVRASGVARRGRPTAVRGKKAAPATSYALFTLRPDELRARIVERPEMVEPGLTVWRDPGGGKSSGIDFATEVGEIDLLATDAEGGLVVVLVAESSGGDPVPRVLELLGWVSKHVAREEQPVRAVVLLEPPATLGYAARAVAGRVSFKTYRVAVAVEDVEI